MFLKAGDDYFRLDAVTHVAVTREDGAVRADVRLCANGVGPFDVTVTDAAVGELLTELEAERCRSRGLFASLARPAARGNGHYRPGVIHADVLTNDVD